MDLHKRIEELERELARHRIFADSVKDYALIEFDCEARITSWSLGAQRLTGFTEQEALGQPSSLVFTPEDRARGEVEKEIETARRDGRAEDERWHLRKDGSRFWASGVMTPLKDRAGFAKVMRDLTHRKQAAEALRQSEENYRLLVENVLDHAIFQVDLEGRVSSWNAGATRLFGYSDQEIIGQPFTLLFRLEDQFDAERELRLVEKSGNAADQRWVVRKDGSTFYAHWVTHLIRDEQGQTRGYAKVLRDETERERLRQLERELFTARVRTADAALDRTRQELRSLAASLMTAQEDERRRIARDLHDDLSQRLAALEMGLVHIRKRLAHEVPNSIVVLEPLIREVGALSSEVRELSHRLHPSVLDDLGLEVALRQLVEDFERSAGLTTRVSTSLPNAASLPPIVTTALYRIAQEALRNASRHAKDARVTVAVSSTGGEVRLTVRDDGPGMDVTAERGKGGLGLISMRERANLAGGSLEIRSAPGEGTELIVTVPCWWSERKSTGG